VAVDLLERVLAVEQARLRALAELLDHGCGDFVTHGLLPQLASSSMSGAAVSPSGEAAASGVGSWVRRETSSTLGPSPPVVTRTGAGAASTSASATARCWPMRMPSAAASATLLQISLIERIASSLPGMMYWMRLGSALVSASAITGILSRLASATAMCS